MTCVPDLSAKVSRNEQPNCAVLTYCKHWVTYSDQLLTSKFKIISIRNRITKKNYMSPYLYLPALIKYFKKIKNTHPSTSLDMAHNLKWSTHGCRFSTQTSTPFAFTSKLPLLPMHIITEAPIPDQDSICNLLGSIISIRLRLNFQ